MKKNFKSKLSLDCSKNQIIRVLWIIILTIGLLYCVVQSFVRWRIEPDITTSSVLIPESEIPFPAVTICSTLFDKRLQHITSVQYVAEDFYDGENVTKLSPEVQNHFQLVYHTCRPEMVTDNILTDLLPNRTEKDVLKLLAGWKNPLKFYFCYFKGTLTACDLLFTKTITDFGVCNTYNWQGHNTVFNKEVVSNDLTVFEDSDIFEYPVPVWDEKTKNKSSSSNDMNFWTLENGYSTENEEVWPVRAERKHFVSFNMLIYNRYGEAEFCRNKGGGLIFMLHLPNELPTLSHQKNFIAFNDDKKVEITAKSFKTRHDLRHLKPRKRQCYYESERTLKFFKSYTKAHCDFECMTNHTLEACGCVKFSMPREKHTPVCDIDEIKCYYNAMQNWPKRSDKHFKIPCECYPPCSNIKYSIQNEGTGKAITYPKETDE
ncbi:unnamed protein product [Chironomus riparius]|uniref:Pickpocket protein 28-like n=1 Tax=Chironomus riparius TaxID=315576 RepID=A0A9N9WU09_9DIPT|nr:unnamed protein product [Chironomus riparius]